MRRAEVWAPRPSVIELQIGDVRHAMQVDPERPGWWISEMFLQHGDRYGFVLDGAGPFPDPRSMSQPDGVHGLSRCFAQARTGRASLGLRGKVLYEMHVGTFTDGGTLDSAIERLVSCAVDSL